MSYIRSQQPVVKDRKLKFERPVKAKSKLDTDPNANPTSNMGAYSLPHTWSKPNTNYAQLCCDLHIVHDENRM